MKITCAERLPFIVSGLSFLQPALTNSQFYNLTLIVTALVLGAEFSNLHEKVKKIRKTFLKKVMQSCHS